MKFAQVIVNISHENVDRPFEYIIPGELEGKIKTGSMVNVPFGKSNRPTEGYVIGISKNAGYDIAKLKSIASVDEKSESIERGLIELADFIRINYGGTMNQALRTVLPVKRKTAPKVTRSVRLNIEGPALEEALLKYAKDKRSTAKRRLLEELSREKEMPLAIVRERLHISDATVKALERDGAAAVSERTEYRNTVDAGKKQKKSITLNTDQRLAADDIWNRYTAGELRPSLIHGVTGSGKTEIYIELIERMIKQGRQAIVLIPEIALTYQTVIRFYRRFGERVSVINSRLTPAEKYDQFEKAKRGLTDVIIGPRSALFTPFKNLGIIIIDEEHEGTYRNENVPRYHAREVAIKRAEICGGIVVMGSATPSVEAYCKARRGSYALYKLEKRAQGASLARVEIVDLREELHAGNRRMTSARLRELIEEKLEKGEQTMLFINRRGYSSFVSCRECGQAIKCPHCDVSLKYHKNGRLICHYCGYETQMVRACPSCGSKYIGTFGSGTQKVEEEIRNLFPAARVLRMDLDTTREKHAHEKILNAFANNEADILIGTQMIVKGHDFPNVTLVGIMAADLSLYAGDFRSEERTFQLITQAAGRAGRASLKGNVIIQTYSPENYAVSLGAAQDYEGFYDFEMEYRSLLGYPPALNMLGILIASPSSGDLAKTCEELDREIDAYIKSERLEIVKMGPVDAAISKINDRYRKIIYAKSASYADLVRVKDITEAFAKKSGAGDVTYTFDFSSIAS